MKHIKRIGAILMALTIVFSLVAVSGISVSAMSGAGAAQSAIATHGIDLSYWNVGGDALSYSDVDFAALKKGGCDFVILRMGYDGTAGTKGNIDKAFYEFYKRARAADMDIGVYYYSLATTYAEAKANAQWVMNIIEKNNMYFEYPIYLDAEDWDLHGSTTVFKNISLGWCETLEANGYFPGIYSYNSMLSNLPSSVTSNYDTWLTYVYTDYNGGPQYSPTSKDWSAKYNMWQYTYYGQATFGGIKRNMLDVNVSYKNYPAIMEKYGYNNINPTYTVTFNANGGQCTTPSAATDTGKKLTSLPVPTRVGYAFNGWNTKQDGSGTNVTTSTVLSGNCTLYAQWTQAYQLWVNGIQVTAKNASDVLGAADSGATVTYNATTQTLTLNGAKLSAVDTTRTAAIHLKQDDTVLELKGTNTIDVSAVKNAYGVWCNNTGAVIKGSGSLTVKAPMTAINGNKDLRIEAPNITASSTTGAAIKAQTLNLADGIADTEGAVPFDSDGNGSTDTMAVNSVAAKSVRLSSAYTVSFDANGGKGTMAVRYAAKSSKFQLPANGFTAPSGKFFKAWSVGGKEYAAYDEITVNGNVTVKAVWTASHTHKYGSQYKFDATHHWNECSCGDKKNTASHVEGAAATATKAQVCTKCGYVITPALGATNTDTGKTTVNNTTADDQNSNQSADGDDATATTTKKTTTRTTKKNNWWPFGGEDTDNDTSDNSGDVDADTDDTSDDTDVDADTNDDSAQTDTDDQKGGIGVWGILAIILGGLVALAILFVVVLMLVPLPKEKEEAETSTEEQ